MQFVDFLLHLDKHLANIVHMYGTLTYGLVFLVIFAETGLVITPFLPGDSLLFILGTFAATHILNIWFIYFTLLGAALVGDNTNYWIGRRIGPAVFSRPKSRFFSKENLDKAHKFYEKYGTKAIILSRFVPVVRTFSPFVAGVARMRYLTFFTFSLGANLLWVSLFTLAGFFFGTLPIVKKNFELVVVLVIIFSTIPIIVEYLKHKHEAKKKRL